MSERPEPWFARGLRFACTSCGACCSREGDVVFSAEEAERVIRHLHGDEATAAAFAGELWNEDFNGDFIIAVPRGGSCPFLDESNLCSIHEIKPLQCRTYPFWPDLLASRTAWDAERQWCEGIGYREVVDANSIAAMLNLQQR